jgi:mono/diheme cytochrome c family protein
MTKNLTIGAALLAAAITVTTTSALAADGKALYEKDCAKCHGVDGRGNTKMGQRSGARDYSNPKTWEGLTDAAAVKAINDGVKDKEGKLVMKPAEGATEAAAKAMVEYMKTFKK